MASQKKPYIVLMPGSFSTKVYYTTFMSHLTSAGYEVECISMPSVWDPVAQPSPPTPSATMADDAAHVAARIQQLLDAGTEDIVLLAHSYAGIPASEAAKGLGKSEREANGLKGGIVKLVYLAALVPKVGQSSTDIWIESADVKARLKEDEKAPNPELHAIDKYWYHKDYPALAAAAFSSIPPAEGLPWAQKMCRHSAASFEDKLTYPGYKDIPAAYLLCTKDKVVYPGIQKRAIQAMRDQGTTVDVFELQGADHVPNVTRSEETAKTVRKAIGEVL